MRREIIRVQMCHFSRIHGPRSACEGRSHTAALRYENNGRAGRHACKSRQILSLPRCLFRARTQISRVFARKLPGGCIRTYSRRVDLHARAPRNLRQFLRRHACTTVRGSTQCVTRPVRCIIAAIYFPP